MFFQYQTQSDDRARSWCFIAYPDSMPIDWIQRLEKLHLPFCVSPLHSPDDDDGETSKKSHWHVIVEYSSPATAKKVLSALYSVEVDRGIGGFNPTSLNYNMIQIVQNRQSYIRYMCHLDQPDKEKLRWEDMRSFNGIDIDVALNPTFSQELDYCNEILDFVESANVYYFCDLIKYAQKCKFDTWFIFLKENSYFIKEYLRSKSSKREYRVKKALLNQDERLKLKNAGVSLDSDLDV